MFGKSEKIGISGAIIFHLILIVIFLLFNIKYQDYLLDTNVEIELEEFEDDELERLVEERERLLEEIDKFRKGTYVPISNKAVNESSESNFNEDIKRQSHNTGKAFEDVSDDRLREEIDRFLHPEKYASETTEEIAHTVEDMKIEKKVNEFQKEEYKGKTNVSYDLGGREHRYLHVPVYQCIAGGLVVVNVVVDKVGRVEKAIVNETLSESVDKCLQNAAVNAAKRSIFMVGEGESVGNINYVFVAQ